MSDWISVDERLPPLGVKFDAWHVSGVRLADHGAYLGNWDDQFRRSVMQANGITHWMPLPEPPR